MPGEYTKYVNKVNLIYDISELVGLKRKLNKL